VSAARPSPSPTQRFRPEQHLRRAGDFRRVREQGRRIDGGAFTLWWRCREAAGGAPDTGPARVGVVASTAAVGSAVRRNAAKRRLRELFRRNQQLVPAGMDLILIARSALNRLRFPVVESRFAEACRRLAEPGAERR
jgi:ribonuclease P protein component